MKIPSRARKTSKLSALFKKVSIADLPYEALDIVFGNINQHQALALASLHSKLQYLMKKSFIKTYIYIYRIGCGANTRKGRNFRYSGNINNLEGYRYTLI